YLSWSRLTWVLIAIALIWSMISLQLRNVGNGCRRAVINQVVINNYCYLPAAFFHRDLTFKFEKEHQSEYSNHCMFWPVVVEGTDDQYVIKMTMGMSYMYLPFFLSIHYYTL